jgi:hypothetical protein
MVQATLENSLEVLVNINIELSHEPSIPSLGVAAPV